MQHINRPAHTRINCAGKELDLSRPAVMGILNLTPDSFYDGGMYRSMDARLKQAEKMLQEGAAIIDIGAVSTRPGAIPAEEKEEIDRLLPMLKALNKHFPGCIISVDTFRASVARIAIDNGAGMINDIFGGRYDGKMIETVVDSNIPYILMHMHGTPATMQENPFYGDVVKEVDAFFTDQLSFFPAGYKNVILDPGFGFGKNVEDNYKLLYGLGIFKSHGLPILAGLSRKSMIGKVLHINPANALNGTTVLNTIALLNGADILRVHDVKEAVEAVNLVYMMDK